MPIDRIPIKDFRRFGYLQEANRVFFHPLGLALEVVVDSEGEESLGGVWISHDPEGIIFNALNEADREKARRVRDLWKAKARTRLACLGYVVQPIPGV